VVQVVLPVRCVCVCVCVCVHVWSQLYMYSTRITSFTMLEVRIVVMSALTQFRSFSNSILARARRERERERESSESVRVSL